MIRSLTKFIRRLKTLFNVREQDSITRGINSTFLEMIRSLAKFIRRLKL